MCVQRTVADGQNSSFRARPTVLRAIAFRCSLGRSVTPPAVLQWVSPHGDGRVVASGVRMIAPRVVCRTLGDAPHCPTAHSVALPLGTERCLRNGFSVSWVRRCHMDWGGAARACVGDILHCATVLRVLNPLSAATAPPPPTPYCQGGPRPPPDFGSFWGCGRQHRFLLILRAHQHRFGSFWGQCPQQRFRINLDGGMATNSGDSVGVGTTAS